MPSTYTTNLGIEKPATGEQSGTWGDTVNLNYDLFDQAINGVQSVTLAAAGSSGSPRVLAITDGTVSEGRNKFIEFVDGGDLGATAYVQLTPNNAEKIVHFRNSLSANRSVIVFQGTYNASNDFQIPNGKDVVLKFDGAGSGAVVADVFVDLQVTGLTAGTADINGGTLDGVTIGGASAAAATFTDLTASGTVDFSGATISGVIEVNSSSRLGLSSPSYNIDATGESSFWVDPAVAGTLLNRVTTSLSGAVVRIKDEGTLLYEHTYLGNVHIFNTYSNGSGIYLFEFGGVGTFSIGENKVTTGGTHRVSVLELGNVGSAPSAAANQASLYTESGELKVVDAAGNVTVLSPHNFSLIPEGPSEDMAWGYYSERDGKKINVDMLKALRILEQLSGEKLVYEEN